MSRTQLGLGVVLMLLSAALAWQVQGWRYGQQLALQAQTQADVAASLLLTERARRQSLEQRIQENETRHFQELADVQKSQARLRDRLATADLRLSVLVERGAAGPAMPAAPGASGVDHATVRARLEPAHAGRIIAITDDGDRGLIALRACQDYVQALQR